MRNYQSGIGGLAGRSMHKEKASMFRAETVYRENERIGQLGQVRKKSWQIGLTQVFVS